MKKHIATITTTFLVTLFLSNIATLSAKNSKLSHIKQEKIAEKKEFEKNSLPPNKRIKNYTLEEALKARIHYTKAHKKPQLAETLERILSLTADQEFADELIIELAELRFELENFELAEALYHEHSTLYPGNPNIATILAREIEAAHRQMLDATRDQTKTKTTRERAQMFLTRFDRDNAYYPTIEKIAEECTYLLLENELNNVEFYLQKYSYTDSQKTLKSAKKRLLRIKDIELKLINSDGAKDLAQKITIALEEQPQEETDATLSYEQLLKLAEQVRTLVTNHQEKATTNPPKKASERF